MVKETKNCLFTVTLYWRRLVSKKFSFHCQVHLTAKMKQTILGLDYQKERNYINLNSFIISILG